MLLAVDVGNTQTHLGMFRDEELPLRTAQARLAVLADYDEREELGRIQAEASAMLPGTRAP